VRLKFPTDIIRGKNKIVIASILIGLIAGVAAVALKTTVHYCQSFLTSNFSYIDYIYLIFPGTGILLTLLFIKYYLKGNFFKGSAYILYRISKKLSLIEKESMFTHIITSILTVGFGGSAGLESPIVVTGAAIGSNFARVTKFSYRERTLLLACGSAAGIASIFGAPVAGVMFALEVLLSDATISSFIPLIIAAATGALCSKIILQEKILLYFETTRSFNYYNVPYYFVLGIIAGLVSIYYARMFGVIERFFKILNNRIFFRAVIGGLILALLVFLMPPLFGEGYQSIKILASGAPERLMQNSIFYHFASNQWFVLLFIGVIIFVKVIATAVTLGSGGNGGNFAPSLFVGAFLGFFFARSINIVTGVNLPEANFTLVGMAGILSGVMYAPLTGIFLIAEVTGGYSLMIPLMVVSSFAYVMARHLEPYSMDTKDLIRNGHLFRGNRDKELLNFISVEDLIEKDIATVSPETNLRQLTDIISKTKRGIFPVIDSSRKLLGIIVLNNIRKILFELENYENLPVIELMSQPAAVIEIGEDIHSVMGKFDSTGLWALPVVDKGIFEGYISRADVLVKYRNQLKALYPNE
jgi:CIC family chloride channel protein